MKTIECADRPEKWMPVVDYNKCEAQGPCIPICPYNVFELLRISDQEYKALGWIGKLKTQIHGRVKAVVVQANRCHACGLCVKICPEKAIKLVKFK